MKISYDAFTISTIDTFFMDRAAVILTKIRSAVVNLRVHPF
jgi:hypothetical protein